jgi:hypothetical protein
MYAPFAKATASLSVAGKLPLASDPTGVTSRLLQDAKDIRMAESIDMNNIFFIVVIF